MLYCHTDSYVKTAAQYQHVYENNTKINYEHPLNKKAP